MSELEAQFGLAAENVKTVSERPDNDTLLNLYAHYKQATQGDVAGKRPGLLDPAGRAKFDAWQSLEGTTKAEAQRAYISLVRELKP